MDVDPLSQGCRATMRERLLFFYCLENLCDWLIMVYNSQKDKWKQNNYRSGKI